MNNTGLYMVGFVIFVIGLAIGAHLLGAPPIWIGIGALVLLGFGVMSAVSKTRLKESSPSDDSKKVVVQDSD